jgi:type IV pilus modification protein PilV
MTRPSTLRPYHPPRRPTTLPIPTGLQQGLALVEALVASAVLGIGLLGATQLTLKTLQTARENRQHTVAQQLAQEAMDCLRRSIAQCPAEEEIGVQGVRYARQTRRTPRGDDQLIDLYVSVQWQASGARTRMAASANPNAQAAPSHHRIEWHSSASGLPGWLGVSSP